MKTISKNANSLAVAGPRTKFWIYVIELPREAAGDRHLLAQNPHRDPAKECLYVGSTGKPILERLREHQERIAGKAARITKRYGALDLRPDLGSGRYAMSRARAVEMERILAQRLRARGYTVSQG